MKIRNTNFDFKNKAYIMGILNVTPDSFSDGSKYIDQDKAIGHALEMVKEGASIIDIGGESTRPGSTPITSAEELRRILPVIRGVRKVSDVVISVDTYRPETWKAAHAAGADLLNDISGGIDDEMVDLCADLACPILLMHNRRDRNYKDFWKEFLEDMHARVDHAIKHGIKPDKIILDPGVGFAKDYEKDLIAINRLDELVSMGFPVVLATSKKRFIGTALNGLAVDERSEGTMATTAVGILKGARIFRVHNVKENYRIANMTMAILNEGSERKNVEGSY